MGVAWLHRDARCLHVAEPPSAPMQSPSCGCIIPSAVSTIRGYHPYGMAMARGFAELALLPLVNLAFL